MPLLFELPQDGRHFKHLRVPRVVLIATDLRAKNSLSPVLPSVNKAHSQTTTTLSQQKDDINADDNKDTRHGQHRLMHWR